MEQPTAKVRVPLVERLSALLQEMLSDESALNDYQFLADCIAALDAAESAKVKATPPKNIKRTFHELGTKRRIQMLARDMTVFADKNGQSTMVFYIDPEDTTNQRPLGFSNGNDEFVFNAVMTAITQHPKVGMGVLRRMHDTKFVAERIAATMREHPELVVEALKDYDPDDFAPTTKFQDMDAVELLAPDVIGYSGPMLAALQKHAGKRALVVSCNMEEVVVRVDDDGSPVNLCYPLGLAKLIPPESVLIDNDRIISGSAPHLSLAHVSPQQGSAPSGEGAEAPVPGQG